MATLPRGLRNNNPGNLIHSAGGKLLPPYTGEVRPPKDSRFRTFSSMPYGYRAMFVLLKTYNNRGVDTIEKIINTWAPPVENATSSYIANVEKQTGINRYTKLNINDQSSYKKIVAAISKVENGLPARTQELEAGLYLFNNPAAAPAPSPGTPPNFLPIIGLAILYFFLTNK
jgi:hypothetical protein